ncbi:hypothetical protein BGX28_007747 [Mortierella sp. GBA30]|nr:hypothetical protein BGX28_007747 [Mortierella sp. GBA30]
MEVETVGVGDQETSLYQSIGDDLQSSSIGPEELEVTVDLLAEYSGGFDVNSSEGIEYIRQTGKVSAMFDEDPSAAIEFNKSLKGFIRACHDVKRKREKQKD